jgi:glycosyltransferase involved in cell wall biosynthesis
MTVQQASLDLRIGVAVASLGRPDELGVLLRYMAAQTIAPAMIILSVTKESDIPPEALEQARVIYGPPGLPAQRNRAIEACMGQCDVIAFFDDDYVPAKGVIEGLARIFSDHPDVVGATGTLLADGVGTGGMDPVEACRIIDQFDASGETLPIEITLRSHGLYGCNMAFRMSSIGDTRFDEALPLYGWQEDMDFSALIMQRGRIIKTNAFIGVHCGVTRSRSPGLRLGYSQIANPTYLVRKGTMQPVYALNLMIRNMIANHVRLFRPEPWIDRAGRMKGNWLALRDLVAGKLKPNRILEISPK